MTPETPDPVDSVRVALAWVEHGGAADWEAVARVLAAAVQSRDRFADIQAHELQEKADRWRDERMALSSLLRGMAERASFLRRQYRVANTAWEACAAREADYAPPDHTTR